MCLLICLFVWVDNVSCEGKEMSLDYESSAAQRSSLKWGDREVVRHVWTQWLCGEVR